MHFYQSRIIIYADILEHSLNSLMACPNMPELLNPKWYKEFSLIDGVN